MKVTLVPAQIVVAEALILTLAVKIGLTVIEILLEVAGEPVKQGVALDVNTTVTASLLAKVVDVNVDAASPETSVPFICH